ncbi:MAG: hypothetical protein ACJ75I_11720 [Solirubrobacterales bacterium]
MNRLRRYLTPSNALAGIALFVALGGVAYAGSQIGTADIQNGAVTTSKLADKAVTGRKVDKEKLGTVPRANAAATVGGMTVQKFTAKPPPDTPLTLVKTVGTLVLKAGCSNTGHPTFTVQPAAGAPPQGTRVSVVLNGNAGEAPNNTIGKGQGSLPSTGISVLDGTENSIGADGTVEAATASGKVTTVQWSARGTANFPTANPDEFDCFFYGTGLSG